MAAHRSLQLPVPARLILPLLLFGVAGCHSALGEAMDHFAEARYPSAAAQFRLAEPAARQLEPRAFAKYALYRGLTHLALGDAQAAASWIGRAKHQADRDPMIFSDRDHWSLIAAWRSMGYMPGEPRVQAPVEGGGALLNAAR